jgi:hypothetical protein
MCQFVISTPTGNGAAVHVTQTTTAITPDPSTGAPSSTSNAAVEEALWMSQQPTHGEIFAEPECDDSYTGCEP